MIGEKLKRLRLEKNKTQRAVAKETSFSHSYYGDLETGRTMPSVNSLKVFADYFGVSVGYFFDSSNVCCFQKYIKGEKNYCYCEDSVCKNCPLQAIMNKDT